MNEDSFHILIDLVCFANNSLHVKRYVAGKGLAEMRIKISGVQ